MGRLFPLNKQLDLLPLRTNASALRDCWQYRWAACCGPFAHCSWPVWAKRGFIKHGLARHWSPPRLSLSPERLLYSCRYRAFCAYSQTNSSKNPAHKCASTLLLGAQCRRNNLSLPSSYVLF